MPLSSMTGFARADGSNEACRWTWELRSVNGQIEWLLREALAKRGHEIRTASRTNARRPRRDE